MKSTYRKKYKRNTQPIERLSLWVAIIGGAAIAYLCFLLVHKFFFFFYYIQSNEMMPHFQKGERLIIIRNFAKEEILGRFILIQQQKSQQRFFLRKVAALPGDQISLDAPQTLQPSQNAVATQADTKLLFDRWVWVNEKRKIAPAHALNISQWKILSQSKEGLQIQNLGNSYAMQTASQPKKLSDADEPENHESKRKILFTLSENEYYVLGEKNTALDSRIWGPINERSIVGVVYE